MSKVVTGDVRLNYIHVFEPWAAKEDQEKKFSVRLLVPKSDYKTVLLIKKAIEEAKAEGVDSKFQGDLLNLKFPLRDGDQEDINVYPEYKGMYFFNAKSSSKPIILDEEKKVMVDKTQLYSGCWAQASINFYPYSTNGNEGVGVGLNALRKRKDDGPLGSRKRLEEVSKDFVDLEDEFLW